MDEISRKILHETVVGVLGDASIQWTSDRHGNAYGWVKLRQPDLLTALAPRLAEAKARLLTITAYLLDKYARGEGREIAYHFDREGVVLTVTVCVETDPPRVPSLTRWFHSADWNEREFMELYDIIVEGHPNPRRLFLDKDTDARPLDNLIPLSTMMNGACTSTLWEKVFAGTQMPQWAKESK